MDYVPLVIQIVVAAVVLAPILWIVGKWFVGKDKAKFTDAVWIGVLGVVIGAVIGFATNWAGWTAWAGSILGTLVMIVVWLVLITHFFDCGLFKGLAIAIIAGIVYWIVTMILSAILVALGLPGIPSLW